jgi:hypothetical protein
MDWVEILNLSSLVDDKVLRFEFIGRNGKDG